ncbi:MAG: Asp-tRNA(Asn)/Glu-tRNA(Gln) amidotransferase subunit GatA [Oscillospiraceae bacterium]
MFERIDEVEPKIESFVSVTKEYAVEQAKIVDEKLQQGKSMSPLAGIPIAIKDNICTKDILTTCCSKMLADFIPPYNATVIEKLQQCDFIMPGKLNMDEFAMGSSTETSYFKKTKNPHNIEYIPGGSSGGSATSVASGQAVLSLGSDTGGSVRQPASLCGVVGLKPTYGTISRYGLVAFASSLDQIGPIGRSVSDVAMLYSAICGQDKFDATTIAKSYPNFYKELKPEVKGIKIGIPEEYFANGVNGEVKQAVMNAVNELEKNGAILTKVSLPSTNYALNAYYVISSAEASSNLARFDGVKYGYRSPNANTLAELYENTRSEGFGDEVKRRIMLGTFVLSSEHFDDCYRKARMVQQQILDEFNQVFTQCDIVITPTTPTTAFKIGENINDPLTMYASDICTVTANIAGIPALSIPCGIDNKGLPIGMQLIGPKFSVGNLVNLASDYEALYGGFNAIPII